MKCFLYKTDLFMLKSEMIPSFETAEVSKCHFLSPTYFYLQNSILKNRSWNG